MMPMCRAREWNTATCVDSRRDVVSIPGGGRMELIADRRAAVVQGMLMILLSLAAVGFSDEQKKKTTANPVREIYVPFEDFNVLLESQTRHVFMTRKQYQELVNIWSTAIPWIHYQPSNLNSEEKFSPYQDPNTF